MHTTLISVAAVACASAVCSAQVWNFPISGLQEVPANAATGTGTGTVTYLPDTNVLSWVINWQGLTGSPTAMHFHLAAAGANGPHGIHIMSFDTATAGSSVGAVVNPSPAVVTALFNGGMYINIHTLAHPAGEIRGQVVPAPGVAAIGLLGAGVLASRRRR